jgi:hypothetical protein
LADALAFTGALDEAASIFKALIAEEHAPCRAGDALGRLANRTPEDRMETVILGP